MLHGLGYCFALLIGLILGLVGSGGGILAVPVLVYLFGLDTMVATVYSLFVVGISSAVAGVRYWQRREVEWPIVLRFGFPAVCSIISTAICFASNLSQLVDFTNYQRMEIVHC